MKRGYNHVGKKIVLTGGGTAGHVSLNQAIIPTLLKKGYEVHYIGSKNGIEKDLISTSFSDVPYHSISSGKLRRYFSWQNFSDTLKVMAGVADSLLLLNKIKPTAVFSKGGFVSVPVVVAAKFLKIPVVIHESDVTPGLANKLSIPLAKHIFTVFPETLRYLDKSKSTCSGAIIRSELLQGSRKKGLEVTNLDGIKHVMLVMGGSQGSELINEAIRKNLQILLSKFDIIHLCGKGKLDNTVNFEGYVQFEYVSEGLNDLLHASDIVVSRAGSNSIFEFLALRKPMLLIPLSAQKSRGDQIQNAALFEQQGFAKVIEEEMITPENFLQTVELILKEKKLIIDNMGKSDMTKTPEQMVELIEKYI